MRITVMEAAAGFFSRITVALHILSLDEQSPGQ
jgi:hypothetical protein